jgi:hypothetical protein
MTNTIKENIFAESNCVLLYRYHISVLNILFCNLQNVETSPGAHPSFFSVGMGDKAAVA